MQSFSMRGFAQPEDEFASSRSASESNSSALGGRTNRPSQSGGSGPEFGEFAEPAETAELKDRRPLAEPELESALQLLVERAQYITGATGTALALPQGNEMVCRASAGASAPAIGARLQVVSGLTGESIARRQLLRCDNAETDPRVNLEACRALGIASIVVLPLFRKSGEVRGLIELFSDHPYAFEERDLVALERMADLTMTALDLADRQQTMPAPKPSQAPQTSRTPQTPQTKDAEKPGISPASAAVTEPVLTPRREATISAAAPAPAVVPEAMRRVQKCASCGFPVSEGRTVCLDCEKRDQGRLDPARTVPAAAPAPAIPEPKDSRTAEVTAGPATGETEPPVAPQAEEFVPAFLVNAASSRKPWIANPISVLAIIVLIAGILVAVVILR